MRYFITVIVASGLLMKANVITGQTLSDGFKGAELLINKTCSSQAIDRTSREHCVKRQKAALKTLKKGSPPYLSKKEFEVINYTCEKEWPEDFAGRLECQHDQIKALEALHGSNPTDLLEGRFENIREKCTWQWPYDFKKRLECENEEIEKLRLARPKEGNKN